MLFLALFGFCIYFDSSERFFGSGSNLEVSFCVFLVGIFEFRQFPVCCIITFDDHRAIVSSQMGDNCWYINGSAFCLLCIVDKAIDRDSIRQDKLSLISLFYS